MLSVPQIDTGKIDIFKQNYEQISIKFCYKNSLLYFIIVQIIGID